ncbi:MAG: GNAT family N-acetyltransferase [Christensenellaceae bacterium]|nr:GNAT family N-acetyltransferase [Christensenellaceae bacterium]
MCKGFTVRPAQAGDGKELSRLLGELFPPAPLPGAAEEAIAELAADPNALLLVAALPDGTLAGTAVGMACRDMCGACKRFLVIENVITCPRQRGKGIARAIFNELEAFAHRRECTYMLLVSGNEREEAHRFYEKMGFAREAGYRKFF